MQRLDHPTPAGQSANAIPAIHTNALRVEPYPSHHRRVYRIAYSVDCLAHAKHNALPHDDWFSRASHVDSDEHIHAAARNARVGDQSAEL